MLLALSKIRVSGRHRTEREVVAAEYAVPMDKTPAEKEWIRVLDMTIPQVDAAAQELKSHIEGSRRNLKGLLLLRQKASMLIGTDSTLTIRDAFELAREARQRREATGK